MNLQHSWAYHQHIPDGFHVNLRTEIQVFQCRLCGAKKQLPAFLDIKPPAEGCTVEKPIVVKVQQAVDPFEEKGDEIPTGKGSFKRAKTTGR